MKENNIFSYSFPSHLDDNIMELVNSFPAERELPINVIDKSTADSFLKNSVFYRVSSLTFEKKFPRQEAFENVICTLAMKNCRVIYYLKGDNGNIDFYIGIAPYADTLDETNFNLDEYGQLLERAFKGNFIGSSLDKADNSIIERLASDEIQYKTILGVPSRNADKEDIAFQSVDRLVNIMQLGKNSELFSNDFHLLVVWEPVSTKEIYQYRNCIESYYNALSSFSHVSTQSGVQNNIQTGSSTSESLSKGESQTSGTGSSESNSITTSVTKGTSNTKGNSVSDGKSSGTNESASESTNTGHQISSSTSSSTGKSTGTQKGISASDSGTRKSTSNSTSDSSSSSETTGTSESVSDTSGSSKTTSSGSSSGTTHSESKTSSDSTSKSTSNSDSKSTSISKNSSTSTSSNSTTSKSLTNSNSTGQSSNVTLEMKNKRVQDVMKYIEDELSPRIKRGESKGMFRTSIYVGASTPLNRDLLSNAVVALAQGEKNFNSPVYALDLNDGTKLPHNLAIGKLSLNGNEKLAFSCALDSRPVFNDTVDVGTWLTAQEISMIAGFPQKEVPGLELREQVPFGLNINAKVEGDDILHLGVMMQEGCRLENEKVNLSRKELSKHIFVAGTTGSGKTTTCHKLLASSSVGNNSLPFMVIEPAKTEYRALLNSSTNGFDSICIFTVGNANGVPFRFNPLEFLEHETLSGHIDELKAAFQASFTMEAAIPNLLEQGLYRTYELLGWNTETGENKYLHDRSFAWSEEAHGRYFPTMSLYVEVVVQLVNEKGFDARLRDDYIGSIRARVESLTEGAKGRIFDTQRSIDFNDLIDKKVIFELEDVKSPEDKSFIMSLILSRLSATLKARHKKDPKFKHITLIEEAHRLLSKPTPGDSDSKRMGVEMFTDLLAEIRKYGECLIVVDQIPNKLASEVLKNTNTKIIHKLFSKDDKDSVGDTMALDEKQRNYLSYMMPGECVVFSQGWKKPVNVQVDKIEDAGTDEPDIADKDVCKNGRKYWIEHPSRFCAFMNKDQVFENWNKFIQISRMSQDLYRYCLQQGGELTLPRNLLKELNNYCDSEILFKGILKEIIHDYKFKLCSMNQGLSMGTENICMLENNFSDNFEKLWNAIQSDGEMFNVDYYFTNNL